MSDGWHILAISGLLIRGVCISVKYDGSHSTLSYFLHIIGIKNGIRSRTNNLVLEAAIRRDRLSRN